MRRIDIITIFRTLGKVKLNKVLDKGMRDKLISNHRKMFQVARENDEYIASLTGQFSPEAVHEVNAAYQEYANETVDIGLDKLDRKAFGDMLVSGGVDFTLADLASIEPLFKED